jgi:hypothetical protein
MVELLRAAVENAAIAGLRRVGPDVEAGAVADQGPSVSATG